MEMTLEARLLSEKSEKTDFVLGIFTQKDSLKRMQQTLIKRNKCMERILLWR